MNDQTAKFIKRLMNILSVIGLIGTILGAFYLWRLGAFTDPAVLKGLVTAHRYFGIVLFVVIQIIQVVIPIIPGGITMAAGVIIFGGFWGFIYNYIGITIGSVILFQIGQTYGTSMVKAFVKEKTYERYMTMAQKHQRKYNWIFFLLMLSPLAPDDALVLISSQTKMSWRWLLLSVFVGKIPGILAYSYILVYGGGWLAKVFGL
ncbi:MAG: TVP38/TMEM64 family protein [Streptococcaceae bacterium]|jgi:uncharacterized membrane protein YdjX (TVP38/TMEM64 family)|nr:TVP38/TMEM64 family protein [Streptococcaceae bacterium]